MDVTDNARDPQQPQEAQQPGASASSSQQQGGSSASPSSRQQDQYSPDAQQQGSVAQRRGRLPSLWSGRSPFELMRQLDQDMDRLWSQIWGGGQTGRRSMARGDDLQQLWMPQLDIFEREGKMHVHADLPGMKKEDIKLSVENDQLVISGERRSSHEEGDRQTGGFWHSERSYGSFHRAVPLPEGVDPSTADASFRDGVLEVRFDAPKRAQQQTRTIPISEDS